MDKDVEVTYSNDEKKLQDLIQEWINENNICVHCKNEKQNVRQYY